MNLINLIEVLLISTITLAAPLILAALGGYLSERSGVINIALEGNMLTSACVTYIVGASTHDAVAGVMAGVASAMVMGLFHWLLTQVFAIDQVVSGMAINLIALGGTNFLNTHYENIQGQMARLPRFEWHLGNETFVVTVYLVLAYCAPFLLAWMTSRTQFGVRLLATGNDPNKARLAGLSPVKIRFIAQCGTGLLTGLAGAMIVDNSGHFTDNMTAGRGYIALAALVISGWRSIPALWACVVFGFLQATQIALQGVRIGTIRIPDQFWQSLPYIAAIVALAGILGKNRPPKGLGIP